MQTCCISETDRASKQACVHCHERDVVYGYDDDMAVTEAVEVVVLQQILSLLTAADEEKPRGGAPVHDAHERKARGGAPG